MLRKSHRLRRQYGDRTEKQFSVIRESRLFIIYKRERKELTMKSLKETLMERDGLSAEEAEDQIKEGARELNERIENGESMIDLYDDFLADEFGLEPDYWDEFLVYVRNVPKS